MLNGMGASCYDGETSTVLHADICSPVATDPTWSRLRDTDQAALAADGVGLWHSLLRVLRHQVGVLSVAMRHLARIRFDALGPWEFIDRIDRTADGALRKRPYEVAGCWHDIGGEPSLFVFCPARPDPARFDHQEPQTPTRLNGGAHPPQRPVAAVSWSTPPTIQARHSNADCCEIPCFAGGAWKANQRHRRVDAESARETRGQAPTFEWESA